MGGFGRKLSQRVQWLDLNRTKETGLIINQKSKSKMSGKNSQDKKIITKNSIDINKN